MAAGAALVPPNVLPSVVDERQSVVAVWAKLCVFRNGLFELFNSLFQSPPKQDMLLGYSPVLPDPDCKTKSWKGKQPFIPLRNYRKNIHFNSFLVGLGGSDRSYSSGQANLSQNSFLVKATGGD